MSILKGNSLGIFLQISGQHVVPLYESFSPPKKKKKPKKINKRYEGNNKLFCGSYMQLLLPINGKNK